MVAVVPAPGTLIAGKYRVCALLATGGMGVVVEAEQEALRRRVAIKLLRSDEADDPELRERFLREARAAARLASDHVVRVFDVGTDPDLGLPFMMMELLSGRDLAAEIAARGPLPVAEAVSYLADALDAVAEAHAAGIVHRDLKPRNLFLAERADGSRRIKVLDFGISKLAVGLEDQAITSTSVIMGSPAYMSPEQVRSARKVDARSDVWSLGVILYEMLSGEPAFRGETIGDVFAKIREEDLPAIRTLRPDVPEGLAQVLTQCLARDREQRLADAAALRERLLSCATGAESTLSSQTQIAWIGRAPARHRSLFAAGAAIGGAALLLLVAQSRGRGGAAPAPEPSPIAATADRPASSPSAPTAPESAPPPVPTPPSASAAPVHTAPRTPRATLSTSARPAASAAPAVPAATSARPREDLGI